VPSKCGPSVGQVWKFRRDDDDMVKPTSLFTPEKAARLSLSLRGATHRIFGVHFLHVRISFSIVLSVSF